MVAKVAVAVSKGRRRRAAQLLCLLTAQLLTLLVLARCGDGDAIMAVRDILAAAF